MDLLILANVEAERDTLKAENLRLASEVASRNQRALDGDQCKASWDELYDRAEAFRVERDALRNQFGKCLKENDALRQDVQRLSEALRQEIDPPTFMGEPVSLLRKPVKSIADIKECYCPQDKCQAPVIMGRQTPCIRKMKEQK